MRFVKPLDDETLHAVFSQHEIIVTLEENTIIGGLGSAISEWVHQHFIHHPPILHLGIPDRFVTHGARQLLLEEVGLVPDACIDSIVRFEKNIKTQPNQIAYEELRF
jgi:1-deoxy-D-xylulose-5-phosphate synthase